MPETKHVDAASGDVLLLVGTMKGAFVLRSDSARKTWDIGGPYFPGRAIYAMAYDDRNGRKRLWAAVNSSFWGSYLSSSDDYGKTFFGVRIMLRYALIFLIVAIVAGVLGLGVVAGTAAWIARVLFIVFIVLFLVSLAAGRHMPPKA